MRLVLLCLYLIPVLSIAQDSRTDRRILLKEEDPQKISVDQINSFPEVYTTTESVLENRNDDTGIVEEAFYTASDEIRISISYQFSMDYEDFAKIQTYDASYLNKFDNSYLGLWWGLHIKSTSAKYSAVAEEISSSSSTVDPNSNANNVRGDNTQNFLIGGFSLAHRFKMLDKLIEINRVFDVVKIGLNYVQSFDSTTSDTYQGQGYSAEYSLEYRSSKDFFYAAKLDYNWITVERSAIDEERLPDRSLVYGWTSLGFELGYYF